MVNKNHAYVYFEKVAYKKIFLMPSLDFGLTNAYVHFGKVFWRKTLKKKVVLTLLQTSKL